MNILKKMNNKKYVLILKDKAIYGLINCASINSQANSNNPDYFKNYNIYTNLKDVKNVLNICLAIKKSINQNKVIKL